MQTVIVSSNVTAFLYTIYLARKLSDSNCIEKQLQYTRTKHADGSAAKHVTKNAFDLEESRKLVGLALTVIGWKEVGLSCLSMISLTLKSWMETHLISLATNVESSIINRNGNTSSFIDCLYQYAWYMPPQAFLNSFIHYTINELGLSVRERLSKAILKKYFNSNAFYHCNSNNYNDSSNSNTFNPEQILTREIQEFASSLVVLFIHTLSPTVDIIVYTHRLHKTFGSKSGSEAMITYLAMSSVLMGWIRSPGSSFVTGEQQHESEYRNIIGKVSSYAEEIASLGGGSSEEQKALSVLDNLVSYTRKWYQFRFALGYLDGCVTRFYMTILGWYLVHTSTMQQNNSDDGNSDGADSKSPDEVYRKVHNHLRLIHYLSRAIGSLLLSGRDFVKLLGQGRRLLQLYGMVDRLNEGLASVNQLKKTYTSTVVDIPSGSDDVCDSVNRLIVICSVDNASIAANQQLLVRGLSLTVYMGQHLFITGPSGCGKSTLLRCLAGLSSFEGGESAISVIECSRNYGCRMLYLPQRPYLFCGTLREQITYPGRRNDSSEDCMLREILTLMMLEYLMDRDGGLDSYCNWDELLSGGEKQRLSFGRLFYHRPMLAILDESTSAISVDMEEHLYRQLLRIGCTAISISHRGSVRKYHNYNLHIIGSGDGDYTYTEIL